MSLTVSPCGSAIEWSLSARTLKDKPFKMQCEPTLQPEPAPPRVLAGQHQLILLSLKD